MNKKIFGIAAATSFVAMTLCLAAPASAQLTFGFEGATLEDGGFTFFQQSGSRTTWVNSDEEIHIETFQGNDSYLLGASDGGTKRVIMTPYEHRDGNAPQPLQDYSMVLRSPSFKLNASGPLQLDLMGGQSPRPNLSNTLVPPANAGQLGATRDVAETTFIPTMGFALRDAQTGAYVLIGQNDLTDVPMSWGWDTGNAGGDPNRWASEPAPSVQPWTDSWNTVNFSEEDLAPFVAMSVNEGRLYEVDVFTSFGATSWGWMGFDNLRVPGTLDSYQPGDANGDGTVGVADIQVAIENYSGFRSAVPVAKSDGLARAHGDMTGEGDVSVVDFQVMVENYGQSNNMQAMNMVPVAGAAVLQYDPSTGMVTLDPTNADGGIFTTFILDGGPFNDAAAVFPTPSLVSVQDATSTHIEWFDFANVINQPWELGAILEAGLTPAEFLAAFSTASYTGGLGSTTANFDFAYVPEPSSLALVSLGGLFLLRRRRARR